jgi:flagellar protein FliT
MDSQQILSTYEAVSALTGKMLAAAQVRDWENLARLESDCASHVRRLRDVEADAPLSGETRERKVAIIHQILAHDRAIRDLTEPWMAQLSALMNNAGTERKLAVAYGHRPRG